MRIIIKLSVFVILWLLGSVTLAGEIELVSVKPLKHEKIVAMKLKYPAISCTFESIFYLENGVNILAIRLSNSSETPVKVSKLLLGLDESYEVTFAGHTLPNGFNNHQANNELERYREKIGLRWLIVPPKRSVLVCLDTTDWQSLKDLS